VLLKKNELHCEKEDKPAKGKKRAEKADEDVELREWKDDASAGASIAEMINIDKE